MNTHPTWSDRRYWKGFTSALRAAESTQDAMNPESRLFVPKPVSFAAMAKQAREALGMTQIDVARKVYSVSRSRNQEYENIENGFRQPSNKVTERIVDVLNLDRELAQELIQRDRKRGART